MTIYCARSICESSIFASRFFKEFQIPELLFNLELLTRVMHPTLKLELWPLWVSVQLVQVTQCSDLTRGLISNHGDSSNKLHQTKVSTNQCISFSDILHCEKGIVYSNYNLILPSSSIPRVPVVNACTATQNFDAIKVLEDSV